MNLTEKENQDNLGENEETVEGAEDGARFEKTSESQTALSQKSEKKRLRSVEITSNLIKSETSPIEKSTSPKSNLSSNLALDSNPENRRKSQIFGKIQNHLINVGRQVSAARRQST